MQDLWYYTSNGQQMEPVTAAQLKQLAQIGSLKATDLIWHDGMDEWMPASASKALFPSAAPTVIAQPSTGISTQAPREQPVSDPTYPERPGAHDKLMTDQEDDEGLDDYNDRPRRHKRPKSAARGASAFLPLIFGGGILALCVVVGVVLLLRNKAGEAQEDGDAVIDAVTLVREYQADRNRADAKYKGKPLLVQGLVLLNKDNTLHLETDLPSILPGVPPGVTDMVLARFRDAKDVGAIPIGALVQVKGRCTGFNFEFDVELLDCRLVKTVGHRPINTPPKDRPKLRPPFGKPPPVMPPINPPIVPDGSKVILSIQGQLTAQDPLDKVQRGSHHKVHLFKMKAGMTYFIEMRSNTLDSFLRLEDSTNTQLASDDDSGGDLNARITIRPTQDGEYRIIATTFAAGALGGYTLTVRQ